MTGEEAGKVARATFTGDGYIDEATFNALARDFPGQPWSVMLVRLQTAGAAGDVTGEGGRAGYRNPWLYPTPLGPVITIHPGPAR